MLRARLITLPKLSNNFRIPSIKNSSKINRIKQSLMQVEMNMRRSSSKVAIRVILNSRKNSVVKRKTGDVVEILSSSIHHSAKQLRKTLQDYFFIYETNISLFGTSYVNCLKEIRSKSAIVVRKT